MIFKKIAQIEEPLIVLIYKNDEGYSKDRSVGISYSNRSLISEDTQFEFVAIVDCTHSTLDGIESSRSIEKNLEKIKILSQQTDQEVLS